MTTPQSVVRAYVDRSDQYWQQAQELLDQQEIEKASELAWGSVVERVKALALARTGADLRSHREVRDYVKRIANQIPDEELYRRYREAESLHINFYESYFDIDEVRMSFAAIEALLMKLDAYLKEP